MQCDKGLAYPQGSIKAEPAESLGTSKGYPSCLKRDEAITILALASQCPIVRCVD